MRPRSRARLAGRLGARRVGAVRRLVHRRNALAAHIIAGLGWPESLLIGAILAPTDPVFASALVGNDKVPALLDFGALISFEFLGEIAWQGWLFALVALVAARPLRLGTTLPDTRRVRWLL